ncbi:MAG: hypothetical protein PVF17_13190 [Ignavibacteria bacterium]|jgi:hypothetical protein
MRTFIGHEGHYDIYDNGIVVLHSADEVGKLTGSTTKLTDFRKIHNEADREGVRHLIQVMKFYRRITQKFEIN